MTAKMKRPPEIVPFLLIAAATTAVAVMLAICAITHMVLNENISVRNIEIWIAAVLMLGTIVGGQMLLRTTGCAPAYMIIHGIIVLSLILIGGLAVDGKFINILLNSGAVIVGNGMCIVMCLKRKTKKPRRA